MGLNAEEFENAWKLYEAEKIVPLTKENMFKGMIYCMLSPQENYQKQMIVYNRLLEYGLDNPKNILDNEKKLKGIVDLSKFGNQKREAIYRLALSWDESSLPSDVLEDCNNGRSHGPELKKRIDKEIYGMAYKTTSLFLRMCGYLDLAIIDMHVLRGLEGLVKGFEVSEDLKIRGPTDKQYLEIEKLIINLAKKNKVETAIMSMSIYHRDSQFKQGFQTELGLNCDFNPLFRSRNIKQPKKQIKPDGSVQRILFNS